MDRLLKDGLYRHTAEDGDYMNVGATLTVRCRETKSQIKLTVVENDFRYMNYGLDALIANGTIIIKKEHSQHHINFGDGFFVLYPFCNGKPFLFDYIGE